MGVSREATLNRARLIRRVNSIPELMSTGRDALRVGDQVRIRLGDKVSPMNDSVESPRSHDDDDVDRTQ